jgi:hypothetical protein
MSSVAEFRAVLQNCSTDQILLYKQILFTNAPFGSVLFEADTDAGR